MTRSVGTLVDVRVAVLARVSGETVTRVVVDEVIARGVVDTRSRSALVDIDLKKER